jgi:hypothetical protein
MKRAGLAALALSITTAGCVEEPTAYQAAYNLNAIGFRETPLAQNLWDVTFQGGQDAGSRAINNLALRRAAELTLSRGYDWFRITSREVVGADWMYEASVPDHRSDPGLGVDGAGANGPVAVTLEVLMGRGPTHRPNTYDAREIERVFGPRA